MTNPSSYVSRQNQTQKTQSAGEAVTIWHSAGRALEKYTFEIVSELGDGLELRALGRRDFVSFAKGYNGSGQAKVYGELIGRFVEEWEKI